MAISFVAGSVQSNYNFNTDTNSVTVDVGTGSDRLIVAFVHFRTPSTPTVSSVQYNSVSMTLAGSMINNGNIYSAIYYLVGPASGSNTLTLTTSANYSQCVLRSAAFTGVSDTSPLDQTNTATGNSTAPAASVTPTEDNELLVGACIHEDTVALTVGSGETSLEDSDHGAWVTSASYAVQTTAAAQSVDWTSNNAEIWSVAVATFEEAAASNTAPTVVLNTADDSELSSTPTLSFTGSDADSDDLTYEIEISTDPNFVFVDGQNLADNLSSGSGLTVHPDPIPASSQIDDRPGQSFKGGGGILEEIHMSFGDFGLYDQDGDTKIRVYTHSGTYGTSSAPANAADAADTPTTGELAESGLHAVNDPSASYWAEHYFTGDERIELVADTPYVLILDWIPDSYIVDNTFGVLGDTGTTAHDGNCYIDGASANNGVQATWDMLFKVYERHTVIEKASNTDSGFSGTPDNSDPFTAGQQVSYTVQAADELTDDVTYHWRVRVKDPNGSDTWSDWTTARSFTLSAAAAGGKGQLVGRIPISSKVGGLLT